MAQMEHCRCTRPDLWDTGESRCCISCGLTAPPETKSSLDHKAEDAEFITNDSEQTAPLPSSRTTFSYEKLRYASEFRLLRLFPGSHEDGITGEVFHANISDPPEYEAVSYTWGQCELTREINTPAGLIKITENCLSALTGLRHDTFERILWVDAICIAQADDLEKNHQIPLMAKIYAGATKVLIYLGDEESSGAKKLFNRLRRDDIHLPSGTINKFLSRPWFSRIWVLQEVAMADRAMVILGSITLEWRHLSIGNIHAVGLEPTNIAGKVPPVLQMSRSDKKPVKDLSSLISIARSCLSSDPRDRFYALLGLVDERAGIDLAPDYTKTTKEVYTDVAVRFLKTYNCLKFLSDIERRDHFPKHISLLPKPVSNQRFGLRTNVLPLHALKCRIRNMSLKLHKLAAKVSNESLSFSTIELMGAVQGVSLRSRWSAFHSLVGHVIQDLESTQTNFMPTSAQKLLDSVHDLHEQVAKLRPKGSINGKDWLHNAAELCEVWKSKLELPDTAALIFGPCFLDRLERRYRKLHDSADLFKPGPTGRESVQTSNESLELPTWVPDYRYQPRLSSLAQWKPNTFGKALIARLRTGSRDHTTQSLEVKAIVIEKVKDSYCTHDQKIRLCDTEVPIMPHNDNWKGNQFEESFKAMKHGASLSGIFKFSQGRRLVLTDASLAIVPATFNPGDVIALLYGGTVPYLLRPNHSEPDGFQFIGECYLHGIRGPQLAPNYAELLGWFKHRVMGQGEQDGLPWRTIVLE